MKVICPHCDKEVEKAETCSDCKFPLATFEEYERLQNALDKKKKKAADEEEAKKPKPVKKSFFTYLGGK